MGQLEVMDLGVFGRPEVENEYEGVEDGNLGGML